MRKVILLAGVAAAFAVTPAFAKAGDVLVRARAIVVAPNESSGEVSGIPGSKVGVGDSVMPEVDFTYMATNNIGAELILATTKHSVSGRGTISGLGDVANTWVLPPTLTLQYHFAPDGEIRPYLGAGINYSVFYSAKATPSLNTALGATKVKLDDSVGYALQAGVDVPVSEKVFVNFDVKYIDMKTTARLTSGATLRTARVKIDPIVAGMGIGFRF
ncbi:MAG TPA: OmpW family protein [Sphingomonas sp.]|nr:OmpW family protein [Sphingomonas sp.]